MRLCHHVVYFMCWLFRCGLLGCSASEAHGKWRNGPGLRERHSRLSSKVRYTRLIYRSFCCIQRTGYQTGQDDVAVSLHILAIFSVQMRCTCSLMNTMDLTSSIRLHSTQDVTHYTRFRTNVVTCVFGRKGTPPSYQPYRQGAA